MLQGYFPPLSPSGKSGLVSAPPWHYAGDALGIRFRADPDAAAATLPPGLAVDPDSPGGATALFMDWQFSSEDQTYLDPVSQYREFLLLVDATWQGTPVSWCPYIYVDNDASLARGWVQGFPKKMGTIHQTRSFPAALVGRPLVNRRYFPRLAAGHHQESAVDELVRADLHDLQVVNAWAGTAEFSLPDAPGNETSALAPISVDAGFKATITYSVQDLTTLADLTTQRHHN
ncbi:acetoacetate decarboxylase family protein [Streptomyces liangshanensis]|uniref:Acetoacetate decarboxylase n=1 Tax=Streptomyces liangshanensis TaxID=2717324 RepID=A0A6G9GSM0_9ACTN|nr:acetoacetate decarboxylase family protein [Streptomyces liangshanensis]QIQ01263.1 acetoacetate decarboxylase [Streptomyces liangshanensis]